MDRTICANERSRREGSSASRARTDALPFRGRGVYARPAPAEGAITNGWVVAVAAVGVSGRSPLGGSRLCPAFAGFPWSQMCFRFTKTSGQGGPRTPGRHFRAPPKEAARHGPSPEARVRAQDPHDRRARGACLHALEILTSDRPGPVAYRACTSTSGCMCTESPSPCARAGAPYVAARVAVAPRPHERRCRSRVCGRGGSDPGVRHASHATAMVGMCTPSHPRLGVTPGHQSLQEGRLRRLKDSATSAVIPSIRSTPVQRRWTGSPEPARR